MKQKYADDMQLYVAIIRSNHESAISRLEKCIFDLLIWFCHNGLVLNPDKTNAILTGTTQRAKSLPPIITINVTDISVSLSENIKIIGTVLDSKLSFNSHIANLLKSCFYYIRDIRHIRPAFTDDVAKTSCNNCSLVDCCLNYANSILFGMLAKKHRMASSNPQHSGMSRYTTTRMNQHHKDVQGPTLASCQVPHRLQGGNNHIQASTVR